MALVSELPESVRNSIANQLTSLIETIGGPQREVGETFPIWVIDTTSLNTETAHLSDVARDISRVTSVIYAGGAPTFSVETRLGGEAAVEVTGVPDETAPEMAQRFGEAFAAIDRDFVGDDGVVRQLEAPAYRLVALWVHIGDADWIYPVEPGVANLEPLRRYAWTEFRDQLLASAPVQGLVA